MQTQFNVKPGDRARITNSVNGISGPSVGREVMVLADRPAEGSKADLEYVKRCAEEGIQLPSSPYDHPHSTFEKVWPVQAVDGKSFVTEYGGYGEFADVPDRWLEKCIPPPVLEKELAAHLND